MRYLDITIGNEIVFNPKELPSGIVMKIRADLIMNNPAYFEAKRNKRKTWGIPKKLYFMKRDRKRNFILPRGYSSTLRQLLVSHRIRARVTSRTIGQPLPNYIRFIGELDSERDQVEACRSILSRDCGVLCAPTAAGKTVMAIYTICARAMPTLIIVHTKLLLKQWINRLTEFTNIPRGQIGIIGDGKYQIGKKVTVAIVNGLYKETYDLERLIGYVIVDECHRAPSKIFTDVIKRFKSKFLLGLSATPFRRDKLTPVIHHYLGDTVYDISMKDLQEKGKIMIPFLKCITSNFEYKSYDREVPYTEIMSALVGDYERNSLIVDNICKHVRDSKGIVLVISDRKQHCKDINEMLIERGIKSLIAIGGMSKKAREQIERCLHMGAVEVLVATGKFIGEGYDLPDLSSIFVVTPIKWYGRVIQYIGRILRIKKGKNRATIYDILDQQYLLRNSFKSRLTVYKRDLSVDVRAVRKILKLY